MPFASSTGVYFQQVPTRLYQRRRSDENVLFMPNFLPEIVVLGLIQWAVKLRLGVWWQNPPPRIPYIRHESITIVRR